MEKKGGVEIGHEERKEPGRDGGRRAGDMSRGC